MEMKGPVLLLLRPPFFWREAAGGVMFGAYELWDIGRTAGDRKLVTAIQTVPKQNLELKSLYISLS